ncbi:MAG: hypothetical protein ACOYXT_08700 [Bacteroidota bacterium]
MMLIKLKLCPVLMACLFLMRVGNSQNLVSLKNNKLVYSAYANEGQTIETNIVPDFSTAGYRGGGVMLPVVKTVITVNPKQGDCTTLIQSAIDEISARAPNKQGFRGAILLKKGVYHVDGALTIKASGIVLRGEGHGVDGTVLVAKQKAKHNFITVKGEGTGYALVRSSQTKITNDYVPTGTRELMLENHTFAAGDHIIIQKTPNQLWIDDLAMAQYGWAADDYKMEYERIVTAVDGNKITVDIPLVDPIESKYGGSVVFKSNITGRISGCGIESMRIESVFENNEDENHGWNAIVLSRVENSWVKDVVAKYFGYGCVSISNMSVFNTVQDCAMIDPKSVTTGGRKYSFNIEQGSTCNLFQRCVSWGGRHDYVTGSRVPGPNVFLDCVAENTFADVGPHHRWSTGILFDNVYGGEIRVQNRKAMGSGHGWAGVQTLFWNCFSVKKEIKVESPLGAKNWGIGCVGLLQNGKGYWESWGTHVSPRSLYLKQLEERLGAQAMKNVTTSEQRSGNVWEALKSWANHIVEENKVIAP